MTVVWDAYCSHCGAKSQAPGGRFCTECGYEFSPRHSLTCPKCGCAVYAEDNFCGRCGVDLHAARPDAPGYCDTCGAQLHTDAAFCFQCGAPVRKTWTRGDEAADDASTTIYGMPPIQDMRLVYAPPDFFGRGR